VRPGILRKALSFINFAAARSIAKIVTTVPDWAGKTTNLQVIYQKTDGTAEGQDDLACTTRNRT